MIPRSLSPMWSDAAAALGNHVWQSTLFALMAGLLTLILSKNPARLRYWLWLMASAKFLIPFSLLVAVGDRLAWLRGPAAANSGLYFAFEEIGVISRATSRPGFPSLIHWLPVLLVVWLCGFVVVLSLWCLRWRKVGLAMREAIPLEEGREVEALRRMERMAGVRKIEVVLSRASLEPGVFGIARPVLIWPEGISARLGDAQLDAIVAHEVWHVRRRDNLAAAMHMVVEAIFWFHPLVWWLGARLVEERERACDEQVLQSGSERQVYAESILKVCEFCLASPLACMSGVAGSDLKKRMVNIMTHRALRKLDFTRRVLLSAAAAAAVGAPIMFGLITAKPSRASTQSEATQTPEPVRVPPGKMQELIRKETKVPPQYPEAAKKARLQGKVILEATISKDGDVENLETNSGDTALVSASIDAVKQWKYKPYLVNGKPVEVKTQVTVNFTLAD
jgi:bla regulator protein blaR1